MKELHTDNCENIYRKLIPFPFDKNCCYSYLENICDVFVAEQILKAHFFKSMSKFKFCMGQNSQAKEGCFCAKERRSALHRYLWTVLDV
jgi:hypothetical protein